jgi:hypothetical protein
MAPAPARQKQEHQESRKGSSNFLVLFVALTGLNLVAILSATLYAGGLVNDVDRLKKNEDEIRIVIEGVQKQSNGHEVVIEGLKKDIGYIKDTVTEIKVMVRNSR